MEPKLKLSVINLHRDICSSLNMIKSNIETSEPSMEVLIAHADKIQKCARKIMAFCDAPELLGMASEMNPAQHGQA